MIIQNPLLTGSLSYNGADLSNVTSSNANSASVSLILTSVSSSNQQLSASYIALSASYNVFSGSASTRITTVSSSQQDISASLLQVSASYIALSGSYNTFSGSASTRVTKIENNYATTGSNSFRADQSITGSLVVSSTITAQTLVVQTVTSSILYSSGSNLFGNQLANTQTFTGSVNITGSLALAGNITSNGTAVMLGTGSANYLSKFTAASTIGNSVAYDNGSQIGISQTTLFTKFSVADSLAATSVGSNYNAGIVNIQNTNTTNGNLSLIGFQDASAFINLAAFGAINEVHSASPNNVKGSLAFYTKNSGTSYVTEKMRLDASGNLGLGVTPSAWSVVTGLQVLNANISSVGGNSNNSNFGSNFYYDGTNFRYLGTSFATNLKQLNGGFEFYTAPSGTAGNAITFTQAMTLFSTGNLAVATTTDSGYKLDVNGTGRFSGALTVTGAYNVPSTSFFKGNATYGFRFNNAADTVNLFILADSGVATFTSSVTADSLVSNGGGQINTTVSPFILYNSGGGGNAKRFAQSMTNGDYMKIYSLNDNLTTRTDNILTATIGGNVGIGTDTPTDGKFVVAQSAVAATYKTDIALVSTGSQSTNSHGIDWFDRGIGGDNSGRIAVIRESSSAVYAMAFYTANASFVATERMRITSGGAINFNSASIYTGAGCVNTTVSTTSDFCFSGLNTNATNPRGLYLRNSATTAGDYALYYEAVGAARFYVIGTGDVKNTNNSYGAISDIRLKENITDATPKLNDLLKVKIKNFNLISDELKTKQIGVIAQELEEIFPSMITEDRLIGSNETIKTVKYSVFVPILIKAIQELKATNDDLQSQINELKAI